MTKSSTLVSILILFLMLPIVFLGCSGGGSSSSSGSNSTTSTSPSIKVLPSAYDFGSVTPDNSPALLEVEIINNGSAELIVSDIALSDLLNFDLDLSGGSDPCGTATLTIAEEDSCTLEVAFRPQSPDSFSTTLNISSNDPNTSTLSVPIRGDSTSPSIKVLPSAYDFGSVTPDNSPALLEVEIINNGSAELIVSDIALSDLLNFDLDLSGGSDPCGTATLTIAEEDSCTLEVAFRPQSPDSFSTTLNISSNDPNTSTLSVPISGSQEEVLELNVKINQVETEGTCPTATVTAYVSVTDQGGYPVTGFTKDDFTITEDTNDMGNPGDVSFVEEVTFSLISVALVMDYSASITDIKDAVDDMEESTASFIGRLGENDEAEIVKFDSEFEVVQDWTSDKDLLTAAIYAPWNKGGSTVLFDAVWQAVDDTASRQKDRKAVIVMTDALRDTSEEILANVIDYANDNNVPIFTVGLGDADISILQQMADDTGGQFYEATTSDNLRTTYNQVAEVLFKDQYILTYVSGLGDGATGDLTIQATSGGIEGEDTKEITCPSP